MVLPALAALALTQTEPAEHTHQVLEFSLHMPLDGPFIPNTSAIIGEWNSNTMCTPQGMVLSEPESMEFLPSQRELKDPWQKTGGRELPWTQQSPERVRV